MLYQKPEMEVRHFVKKDVVCVSTEENDSAADESSGSGEW